MHSVNMKILLLNIIILWCIICTLNMCIPASVKFETGKEDQSRYNKKLIKDYYSNLTQNEMMKTVLEDNEVLAKELCRTLGSAFGEHRYNDTGRKKCFNGCIKKEVLMEEAKFVLITLEKCRCFGERPIRTFFIREYTVDGDISVYFIFDTIDWYLSTHSIDKYYAVTYMFDAAHQIIWKDYFPSRNQESKLTPPPPQDGKTKINCYHLKKNWKGINVKYLMRDRLTRIVVLFISV